jgi:hypothetical protein
MEDGEVPCLTIGIWIRTIATRKIRRDAAGDQPDGPTHTDADPEHGSDARDANRSGAEHAGT